MVDVVHEHLVEQLLVLAILGLIVIQLQLSQLLLGPCRLFGRHLLLPLIFLLLGSLDRLELVEHILVVEDRVGELVTEVVFVEQLLDALGDHREAQDRVDVRSLLGVHTKHTLK